VVDMYRFIKKHASIPFKLKRQESRRESIQTDGVKDEL
jgi:protein disulfide-isomerase A1